MKIRNLIVVVLMVCAIVMPAVAQEAEAAQEAETSEKAEGEKPSEQTSDSGDGSNPAPMGFFDTVFSEEGYNFFGRLNYQLGGSITGSVMDMQGIGIGVISDLGFIFLGDAPKEDPGLFLAARWQWHPMALLSYTGTADNVENVESTYLLTSIPNLFYLDAVFKTSRTQYLTVGSGVGLYTVNGTMYDENGDKLTVDDTKLGVPISLGFTFAGLQMNFVYNIVFTDPSKSEPPAGYFSLDLRLLDIFGGILDKDPEMSPYSTGGYY